MPKIWEYNGYTIDEGMKPHDENYKPDFYQYFFIVKVNDQRKFKYCIWADKAILEKHPEMTAEAVSTGHKIPESVYQHALSRIKEKIDGGQFDNRLLEFDEASVSEVALDEMDRKLD